MASRLTAQHSTLDIFLNRRFSVNRRQNLEMAAKCFFLSGSIFKSLAEEKDTPAVRRTSTVPSSTPSNRDEGELGLLTVRIHHKPVATIVPQDGSGRKFKLFVMHPAMLSEPYVVADETPGEYRVFVPDATDGNLNLKLMARDLETSTGPYVKRGSAQNEYHLHI